MKKLFCLLACAALGPALHADVKLPAIFGDDMVLQGGQPLNFWGKADPQEKVTVSVAGQSGSAVAGADGKWRVKLGPVGLQKEPVTVSVAGKNSITLKNVLVGEVWMGSGQSNMQWALWGVNNGKEEVAAANHPTIRLFTVKAFGWPDPLEDVDGKWEECTPQTAKGFSATLYFFGRDLQKEIGRPVGLINCSKGATIVQSWSPWSVLMSDEQTRKQSEAHIKDLDNPEWVARKYAADMAKYEAAQAKAKAEGKAFNDRKPSWTGRHEANRPGGLFNAMVHPLLGFPIRGVVWYQGEFNANDADQYQRLFPRMIQEWRKLWGIGEFAFYFVQLPGNNAMQTEPCDGTKRDARWAQLREAQAKTLTVPNTAMAVTIDTAPDGDLHPKNKQPVGNRLARLASNLVYGKTSVPCLSPMFESMSRQGSAVRVKFKNAEGGLRIKEGDKVTGFAIAGADRKFVWAGAKIDGESVLVSSPEVPEPVSVRYGWANNPVVSLFNNADLPAAPFRTDDWK